MSNNKKRRYADWRLGQKLSAFTFGLVGLILAALLLTIAASTASLLAERANQNMPDDLDGVVNTGALFNKTVSTAVLSVGRVFGAEFDGRFTLDTQETITIAGKAVRDAAGAVVGA